MVDVVVFTGVAVDVVVFTGVAVDVVVFTEVYIYILCMYIYNGSVYSK